MGINRNFVVKNGIEVANDLLIADGIDQKVGIATTNPNYTLDVHGDVALNGRLFVGVDSSFVKNAVGVVSNTFLDYVSGIDTGLLRVGDYLSDGPGGFIRDDTRIVSIGQSLIEIDKSHTRFVSIPAFVTLDFTRFIFSGDDDQVLVSRGAYESPVWRSRAALTAVGLATQDATVYPTFVTGLGNTGPLIKQDQLTFNPVAGNFGIGTDTPTAKLYVGGNARITGIVTIGPASITLDGSTNTITVGAASTIYGGGDFKSQGNVEVGVATIKELYVGIVNGELFQVNSNGNVGVGSTLPQSTLSVGGDVFVSGVLTATTIDAQNISGNLTGAANTARDVIGGIGSIRLLSVSGISTLESLEVQNDATVGGGLSVTGNTNLDGTVQIGSTTTIDDNLEASGTIETTNPLGFLGYGAAITGIVTQITAGIGMNINSTQPDGRGVVTLDAYKPIGKTIFVSQTGDDANTGLSENHPKRTIKAASAIAFPGDTIKVYPGVYIENNPIILAPRVAVEGTELRNCVVTARYTDRDLFHVNNSCHVTDLSFIGPDMSNGAAIVALQPLLGVSTDRFFDAARMIRYNLDYIAKETVGYLTSTQYKNPAFTVVDKNGFPTPPVNCSDDIKDVLKAVIHDITRGGNSKCVGAAKSYFNPNDALIHITGISSGTDGLQSYSVLDATIDSLIYAKNMTRSIINNVIWGGENSGPPISVTGAEYDYVTGVTTITTASDHQLEAGYAVKIEGLEFSCPDSPPNLLYPTGNYGYVFTVDEKLAFNQFKVRVGINTIPHTYVGGGSIRRQVNFNPEFTQVRDLSIQADPLSTYNDTPDSCQDVFSAIDACVGVVTTILKNGLSYLGAGINTTFPGNGGQGFDSLVGITAAEYNNESGETVITAPNFPVRVGDYVEIRDLRFQCSSSGITSTQVFPTGRYGFEFFVTNVDSAENKFTINTGVSTLAHTYVGEGFVVNRTVDVTAAEYDYITGITTITAPGARVKVGQFVKLYDLEFSCPSGPAILKYPSGNLGYEFRVLEVLDLNNQFTVNVGTSTLPHTYSSGGMVRPAYSKGVGPITQGPYVRNCTNFVGKSIGMKVDGFEAEPGDNDDIGVTGTMSVDSYTQYNQGGIGVSITNGAYAQLVSIFTICDEIAIYTASGGQCDITNSNSSFGNYGLVSEGVGDYRTKSIYRFTGKVNAEAESEQAVIEVGGIGSYRPYDGQVLFFDELYYEVRSINITNGGSLYTSPPTVIIDAPTGPNGIRAEASANIENGRVTSVDIISTGNQYQYSSPPNITFVGGGGSGAIAEPVLYPLYYTIESATLPSAGVSTVTLNTNLNNTVSEGATAYINRLSLQITSSHSFEWVGSGNDINTAKPALGGVVIQENEVVKRDGGEVVYTSTDQAGNFKIGDDLTINQLTGTVTGRAFNQSILNTVTPLIIALGN